MANRSSHGHVTNVLSFDVEHWYSATLLRDEVDDPTPRIRESVMTVLDAIERRNTEATFFVVGEVAREYPDLIARIDERGHEVASHGQTHTPLFDLTAAAFRRELQQSADAIRDATGARPSGFRAPNFSVTPKTAWAVDILRDEGFRYDSSVFPVRTPMYGVSGAPIRPYTVGSNPFNEISESFTLRSNDFVEFPLAVFHPRVPLPIAGGFYARLLPTSVLKRGIRNLNRRGIPATIYFHPWEFNTEIVDDDVPFVKRFISFHGIHRALTTLDDLVTTFEFGSIERALQTA